MINEANFIATQGGNIVNFIPSIAVAVTPSASTTFQAGLLYVGTGGDVTLKPKGNSSFVTFKGVPSGSFLPIYIIAVSDAGTTTASDMLIAY
jgi:hypothetical protein